MKKRYLVIGIILSLVCMNITPSYAFDNIKKSSTPTFNGNTLYVGGMGPDNYSSIQDAIDNAVDGDTVFVFDDSSPYYEHNITIRKSISLIGEDKNTTIIDGSEIGDVLSVFADWINISGFTIQKSRHEWKNAGIQIFSNHTFITGNNIFKNQGSNGIYLYNTSSNTIKDNNISENGFGIHLYYSSGNTITGNNISSNNNVGINLFLASSINTIIDNNIINNWNGIDLSNSCGNNITGNNIKSNNNTGINVYMYSRGNTITVNNILNNYYGIYLGYSDYNTIIGNNIISNYRHGIYLGNFCLNNIITGNNILNNYYGTYLENSSRNNIENNNISKNWIGIYLFYSSNNTIQRNNFLFNLLNAFFIIDTLSKNEWQQNYWNRPRILPKLILGSIKKNSKVTLGFNFDLHPAKEPYVISIG